jgi:hypothetical protein
VDVGSDAVLATVTFVAFVVLTIVEVDVGSNSNDKKSAVSFVAFVTLSTVIVDVVVVVAGACANACEEDVHEVNFPVSTGMTHAVVAPLSAVALSRVHTV